MAASIQVVFALAIGLAVICTGVVSKDCEECTIQKCESIEESSGKVYDENGEVALSATECPDGKNCCSFKDALYYASEELAPCTCPDKADKENDPARGFKGRDDGESDTEGGEGRGWGGINLANPAEVPRRPTPGWFEKEGFVNLGRTFQPPVRNPAIEPLFKNPNTGMPQLSPSGVVMSVRKLVPFAVSELETQQKTSSYSYRDLFARRCTPAGCLAEGEIIKLLKWKMNKDKRFFTGNYAEKVGGIKKAANNFHEAYKLRRENDIYPDDPHLDMTFALKKAVGDLEDFTSKLMNEG